jgi:hypothetical protein
MEFYYLFLFIWINNYVYYYDQNYAFIIYVFSKIFKILFGKPYGGRGRVMHPITAPALTMRCKMASIRCLMGEGEGVARDVLRPL